MLPQFGYALVEEELSKRELDDDILSKENVILHKRMMADESGHKVNSSSKQLNYKVNLNSVDSNNNDEDDEGSSLLVRRNKSILNIEGDENSCPGLAMSEVTYKMDWFKLNIRFLQDQVCILYFNFHSILSTARVYV